MGFCGTTAGFTTGFSADFSADGATEGADGETVLSTAFETTGLDEYCEYYGS